MKTDGVVARANPVLLQTLESRDVMATMMLLTSTTKWAKLANDYDAVSASMGALARSHFHEFRMRDGDRDLTSV